MKRGWACGLLCFLAALAFAPAARADLSPSKACVVPEAIWATASGGGTWVTALQVTARFNGTVIHANFYYNPGSYTCRSVTLATATADLQTFEWANILETMGTLDAFNYSGRVGTLVIWTGSDVAPIWAQAMTTNGHYGKTMPGLDYEAAGGSATVGRYMLIPGLKNSPTYRTFVGVWNSNNQPMDVDFVIMNPNGPAQIGCVTKSIPAAEFVSFNPFAEAGLGAGVHSTWLMIQPKSLNGGSGNGLFCFGSIANNYTNDTYALIAIPFQ